MSHLVDHNDVIYVKERHPDVVGWFPLLHSADGRPQFNTTKLVKSDGTLVSVFHVKPIYYEALGGFWRPLSEITEHHGNKRIVLNKNWRMATPRFIDWLTKRQALFGQELLLPTPFGLLHNQEIARPTISIGLTTTTVYPDPHPETTTCDGAVAIDSSSGWSAAQTATTGSAVDDTGTSSPNNIAYWGLGVRQVSTNTRYRIDRGHVGFDTSSVGSDTISSATMSFYHPSGVTINTAGGSNDQFFFSSSNPASNTGLSTADFDQIGDSVASPTEWSSAIDLGSLTLNSYNDYSFNATGIAGINGSGITNLGYRSRDDDTSNPGWTGDVRNTTIARASEGTGTSEDPKLVIVHTSAGGFAYSQAVIIA